MNREERRRLQRKSKKQVGDRGVWLRGGPMNGWFVTLDAPALSPEWGEPHGGKYVQAEERKDGLLEAHWVEA